MSKSVVGISLVLSVRSEMDCGHRLLIVMIMLMHSIRLSLSNSPILNSHTLSRQKRKLPLLFHDFGVSQFVCGFGVPVDLDLETVTTGIVFKSQLPLPATPADLRNHTTHQINGRSVGSSTNHTTASHIRWYFYKALEAWAIDIGLSGRACVLKTLCEAAQVPFSNVSGDLWHDIAHILFTPTSSVDELAHHEHGEYLAAAKVGLSSANDCEEIFKECPTSLLTFFTQTL